MKARKKAKKVSRPAKKKATAAKKSLAKKPARKIPPKKLVKKPVKAKSSKPVIKRASGIPEILRDSALKILDERQADEIVTVDLTGRSSIADYLIIASGRNARQVSAMAEYLRDIFLKNGSKTVRVEGKSEGNWVLVDAGDVVVHLFRPEVRRYYNLDSLWSEDHDVAHSGAAE